MIKDYIEDLCDELDIDVPEVIFDDSKFATDTMMAWCDGKTIHIRPFEKPTPDHLFAIAHELRHVWQIKNNENLYFSNYKKANETDTETYNLQLAEVDANAFGFIVMMDWFGLEPLYQGMSEKVIAAVKKRMNHIRMTF